MRSAQRIIVGLGLAAVALGTVSWVGKIDAATGAVAEIEELHRQDVAATLTQDPKQLANLFSEDGVLLEPGAPAIIGRRAILAKNQDSRAQAPEMRVISYKPQIEDLQIVGDWAVEWDYFDASYRESEKGEVKNFRAKALRVLRRQPDGSWKFARVMWNLSEH